MKMLAITFCAVLLAACSSTGDRQHSSWADAVGLVENTQEKIICTGTIVAPGVVVTAAHCLDGQEAPAMTFRKKPATVLARGSTADLETMVNVFNGGGDWVLLETETDGVPMALTAGLRARSMPGLAAGYGRSSGRTLVTVSCTPIFTAPTDAFLVHCGIVPGDSGGPLVVFDPEPRVLGIVVGSDGEKTLVVSSENFRPYLP